MKIGDIVRRVQIELEDSVGGGDWSDTPYILGKLSVVGDDIAARFMALDLDYDEDVIVLSGVKANTTDLSAYQQEGEALQDMIFPKTIEYRLVGENDEQWKDVELLGKVRDTNTSTGNPVQSDRNAISSWGWRKNAIFISPSSVDVDIRVRCQTVAIPLNNDALDARTTLTNVHVYGTCRKICVSRGGQMSQLAEDYEKQFERQLAVFIDTALKTQHKQRIRFGGRRTGRRTQLYRPPIT